MTPREIQSALKVAGHDPGPIDGDIGPNTKDALARAALAGQVIIVAKPEPPVPLQVTTADTRTPGQKPLPRGVRNNNPGNIDYSASNDWQGKLPRDTSIEPRFERFDTPENGIRAICKLLLSYQRNYKLDTIDGLIDRWAPPNENPTAAYKAAVARKTGITIEQPIGAALRETTVMRSLVDAIIAVECAGYQYPEAVLAEGVRRGLT